MSRSISVGLFFKKPVSTVGELAQKVPFFPKTLATLVYMQNGDTVETKVNSKVDAVVGKGLSTNDYTTAEKNKLEGLSNYTHPDSAAGAKSSGLYKVTTDRYGHVIAATAVAKSDITALGIPGSDTTYSTGTSSVSGLTKLYSQTGENTDGTMTQDSISSALDTKVPATRKVNNKPLSSDITLSAADVSAYSKTEMDGMLNGLVFSITSQGILRVTYPDS